jgi:SAM-dependent methyltransferase
MAQVDYDQISKIYDDVRKADIDLINAFLRRIQLQTTSRVLDIGCGTGNYTGLLQKVTQARVFGIDPSPGMLEKARQKHPGITFRQAEAARLPFADNDFDFIYMTDVIHHIPDIAALFVEIQRVLKEAGIACIVTQSHRQIACRPIAQFFPGTVAVDQKRYPDIPAIVQTGEHAGLAHLGSEILSEKGYSMLHLISDEEYQLGLKALELRLQAGPIPVQAAGGTLVWFEKTIAGKG